MVRHPQMLHRLGFVALLLPSLELVGCSAELGRPPPPADLNAEVTGLRTLHDAKAITKCLNSPLAAEDVCRNSIVQARLITIDAQYTQFRQAFYGEARWGDFAATVVSLGLTSAASLSPLSAAHILGAAATGVTGTQAAYQKQVLIDQTANAIETSMDSGRDLVSVRIRQGLQRSAQDYPLAVALSDLEDYYNAGTLLGALADITKNAGVQAQNAEQQLKTVSGFDSTPAALYLQAYLNPQGATLALRTQHDTEIANAEKNLGIPYQAPFEFVTAGDPDQQAKVAKQLGWSGQ